MNVRGGAGDARGRNAALHRHVVADRDGPAALRWRRDRGNFLIAGHRDLHVSGQCDGRVRTRDGQRNRRRERTPSRN